MLRIPKTLAICILILVIVMLTLSLINVEWNVFNTPLNINTIFKELAIPIVNLLLVVFYIHYLITVKK